MFRIKEPHGYETHRCLQQKAHIEGVAFTEPSSTCYVTGYLKVTGKRAAWEPRGDCTTWVKKGKQTLYEIPFRVIELMRTCHGKSI